MIIMMMIRAIGSNQYKYAVVNDSYNPNFNGTPLFDLNISETILDRAIVKWNVSCHSCAIYRLVPYSLTLNNL